MHADPGFTTGDPDNPTVVSAPTMLAATETSLGGFHQMPATPI